MKIKPKTFGPLVVKADDSGTYEILTQGNHTLRSGTRPRSDESSPTDLLLASLGSCIAISLTMAAKELNLEINNLIVDVNANKAPDPPNRIDQFNVELEFDGAAELPQLDELLSRTKSICTISNSLKSSVNLITKRKPGN